MRSFLTSIGLSPTGQRKTLEGPRNDEVNSADGERKRKTNLFSSNGKTQKSSFFPKPRDQDKDKR